MKFKPVISDKPNIHKYRVRDVTILSATVITCTILLCVFMNYGHLSLLFKIPIFPSYDPVSHEYFYSVRKITENVKDILPIHSHNDYTRSIPLFHAVKYGCKSFEADIWLKDERQSSADPEYLYVGHHSTNLNKYETLDSLYLDHLMYMLDEMNANNNGTKKNSIYANIPQETVYFVVDFKTHANPTFDVLREKLQRFITKGYLSYYDFTSNTFVEGPLTVIISGFTP
ncbi:hypothetical protein BABINDRAFT_68307, partial [Babjeviella inositovora NRRL Y-12698]